MEKEEKNEIIDHNMEMLNQLETRQDELNFKQLKIILKDIIKEYKESLIELKTLINK